MVYAAIGALVLIVWLAWKKPRQYSGRGDILRYEMKQTLTDHLESWRFR